jgi:hypothetical protein
MLEMIVPILAGNENIIIFKENQYEFLYYRRKIIIYQTTESGRRIGNLKS